MVIVDSSVLIDFLAHTVTPQTAWLRLNLNVFQIGITSLILCEVLQGTRGDRRFAEVQAILMPFVVHPGDSDALAVASALNYRTLRRIGVTVRSTIDCLIATFCIEEGHVLLHNDRDFNPFESYLGLKVLHPADSLSY
jgi:predicted nucleic acid-binding protein